ncbi:MAG TPA: hypothetical protein VF201_15535 [Nitrolancea sp.]
MPRVFLAIFVLVSITACGGSSVSKDERTRAVSAAQVAYATAQAKGTDFSNGPCISEQLADLPDWSVDVAHDPRESVDNQPANQCQAYRQGTTHHFVELDPNGKLIRTH